MGAMKSPDSSEAAMPEDSRTQPPHIRPSRRRAAQIPPVSSSSSLPPVNPIHPSSVQSSSVVVPLAPVARTAGILRHSLKYTKPETERSSKDAPSNRKNATIFIATQPQVLVGQSTTDQFDASIETESPIDAVVPPVQQAVVKERQRPRMKKATASRRDCASSTQSNMAVLSTGTATTITNGSSSTLWNATAAGTVEGYAPHWPIQLNTKQSANDADAVHSLVEINRANFNSELEPLVFNSLADMMAMAGTLPPKPHNTNLYGNNNDDNDIRQASMIEADLEFSCMDRAEHQREQEAIFLGRPHEDIFAKDDDDNDNDDSTAPRSDEDDEGLYGILGLGGPADDDEDPVPAPEPRAFLHVWTAIAQWVTPEAVVFLDSLQQQQNENRQGVTFPSAPSSFATAARLAYDRSDVGASRCAGLMAALRLHTARCWHCLHYPAEELHAAELVLANLLRCFDYRRPMPSILDIAKTRALTCVLLDIVARSSMAGSLDRNLNRNPIPGITDHPPIAVPGPCRSIGISEPEYRYLVYSAIGNFGSANGIVTARSALNEEPASDNVPS